MYNMKKRLTALLSVFLLVCSLLTTNTFAADSEKTISGNKGTTKVTGTCSVPSVTIDVVVPSSEKTYINPTQASVKLNDTISNAQIVTETGYIENRSSVPISVSASVSATVKSGSTMKLVTTSTKDSTSTAKQAFVFFQMQPTDASYEGPSTLTWDTTYDADKHILVTTSTKSKTEFLTLDKYDPDAENDTAKRFGAFLLSGDCVVLPKDEWTTKDGFTANIAFTFKALPYDTTVE
jgi:hypothetical protein